MMDLALIILAALAAFTVALLLRIVYLIYHILSSDCNLDCDGSSLRTILCIGSGGHTTELIRLMRSLDHRKYSPRLYAVADNDVSSEVKIHKLEKGFDTESSISRIPRSRNVNQSYTSSVGTTLFASFCTIPVIFKFKPEVILCNGPGTCIPVCVIAFLMRCLFILDCRIVFIESVCRVRTFSLTGKILQYFADVIIIQWPHLRDSCSRAKYFGRLT